MKCLAWVVVFAGCAVSPELEETEQALNGDTWLTVDDYDNGGEGATAQGITINTAGKLYVIGTQSLSAGGQSWTIRTSTNDGASWTTENTYLYASFKSSLGMHITYKPSTNEVYASGTGTDAANAKHFIVRRSTAGGAWTTVLDINTNSTASITTAGIGVSGNAIYASAIYGNRTHVHYSTNGATWTDLGSPRYLNDYLLGMCATAAGMMFVGYTDNAQSPWIYAVASGSTWGPRQAFVPNASTTYRATSCVEIGNRRHVSGAWTNAFTGRAWFTFYDDNPANADNWVLIDTVASPTYGNPVAMGNGPAGRPYMAGQVANSNGTSAWRVRREDPSQWVDSDIVSPYFAAIAAATGYLYVPAIGASFVTGYGAAHAIVRRRQ